MGLAISAPPCLAGSPEAEIQGELSLLKQAVKNGQAYDSAQTAESLGKYGSAAVASIDTELTAAETNRALCVALVDVVRRLPVEDSKRLLLRIALHHPDPNVAGIAAMSFGNRTIDWVLVPGEINEILTRVRSEPVPQAAAEWARLLSDAPGIPENALEGAFVDRLRVEVERPPESDDRIKYYGPKVDADAVRISPLLRVIPKLKAETLVGFLRVAIGKERNSAAQKMLLLASGLAGDEQGAARLIELLNDKNEKLWIRCEALKGVARSAPRADAIRVLQIYSQDETPGPDPKHRPLQSIARNEMRRVSEAEPK